MAGSVTISAGTWAMPSTRTIIASTPAQGMPASSRQRPTMIAWMKATPMTPCATARMVAVASFVNSAPCAAPAKRSKMARLARLPASTEGHDDAGDDEGGEELQQPDADAGDEAERRLREVADLRLHALDQRRQIGVRRRPDRVELLADHGPRRDALARGRDLERVVLHVVDQLMHRVAQRAHQHGGRHDDQGDAEENQDRRGKPLLPSILAARYWCSG